jgi:FkbM family methyltransferase
MDGPPGQPSAWRPRDVLGLARSIAIYHLKPGQRRRLLAMYRRFVRPGDLCFDIGAHVGNRTRSFRALGARVVAVEPQPRLAALLARAFRGDPLVTVLPAALGAVDGTLELAVSRLTPTVSTTSTRFLEAVADADSFRGVRWDERLVVPALRLDSLIDRHGQPSFVKIDVEGMEDAVLGGLSRPVTALSFELLPAFKDPAIAAVRRLSELGRYRFNLSLGETMRFLWPEWIDASALTTWIESAPTAAPSGDIYAELVDRA